MKHLLKDYTNVMRSLNFTKIHEIQVMLEALSIPAVT